MYILPVTFNYVEISRNKVVVVEAVTIFTALDVLNLEFKERKDRYNKK